MEFSSFEDKALPGKEYSIVIKSLAGAEALAAVFDKSSETIAPNRWSIVRLTDRGAQGVSCQVQDGGIGNAIRIGYSGKNAMFKTRAAGAVMEEVQVEYSMNSMELADAAAPMAMKAEVGEAFYDDAVSGERSDEQPSEFFHQK